jgi:hypothetical protein
MGLVDVHFLSFSKFVKFGIKWPFIALCDHILIVKQVLPIT